MEHATGTGRIRKKPDKLFQGVDLDDNDPILRIPPKRKKKVGEKRKNEGTGLATTDDVESAVKKQRGGHSSSSVVSKKSKKKQDKSHQTLELIPADEYARDADVIRRCKEITNRKKGKPPRQEGATEILNVEMAIKEAVRQSAVPMVDWSSVKARIVGSLCKIFWDGEKQWFYARVLYYDSKADLHFIYYMEDSTTEWLNMSTEAVAVAPDICTARMKAGVFWPAMRYWASTSAREAMKKTKGYAKDGDLVEFFSDTRVREYGFLPMRQVRAFSISLGDRDGNSSSGRKKSKSVVSSIEAAQEEVSTMNDIAAQVVDETKRNIFNGDPSLCVGARVRAYSMLINEYVDSMATARARIEASKPVLDADTTAIMLGSRGLRTRGEQNVSEAPVMPAPKIKSLGTIRQYCPGTNEVLVVFDGALLVPQWVSWSAKTLEILVGPSEDARVRPITGDINYFEGVVGKSAAGIPASVPIPSEWDIIPAGRMKDGTGMRLHEGGDCIDDTCAMCFLGLGRNEATSTDAPSSSSSSSSPSLSSPPLLTTKAEDMAPSSSIGGDPTRTDIDIFRQCCVCTKKFHSYCMPVEKVGIDSAESWRCWNCVACEGCGGSFWDVPQRSWNLKYAGAHDRVIGLCGNCIVRYRDDKDFCPLCNKLYAQEEDQYAVPVAASPIGESSASNMSVADKLLPNVPRASTAAPAEKLEDGSSMDVDGAAVAEVKGNEDDIHAEGGNGVLASTDDGGDMDVVGDIATGESNRQPGSSAQPVVSGLDVEDTDSMMVACNECGRWVHALCEGIDMKQYEAMSNGTHPVWGDEYLCPACRVLTSIRLLDSLDSQDHTGLFAEPVREAFAKNYFDIIHNPMDLHTMRERAKGGHYKSLQSLRQDFELMCFNAVEFNKNGDEYWREAYSFFQRGIDVFRKTKRQSQLTFNGAELQRIVDDWNTTERKRLSEQRKQQTTMIEKSQQEKAERYNQSCGVSRRQRDGTAGGMGTPEGGEDSLANSAGVPGFAPSASLAATKGDVVPRTPERANGDAAGSLGIEDAVSPRGKTVSVTLCTELRAVPGPKSYLAQQAVLLPPDDAFQNCCDEVCLVCGSGGAETSFIICIDCGESVHSFCAEVPLATMSDEARLMWRCTNCKVCEQCGSATEDEEANLVFCEVCDAAYHMTCVYPVMTSLPDTWVCGACVKCENPEHADKMRYISADESVEVWGNSTSCCSKCVPSPVPSPKKEALASGSDSIGHSVAMDIETEAGAAEAAQNHAESETAVTLMDAAMDRVVEAEVNSLITREANHQIYLFHAEAARKKERERLEARRKAARMSISFCDNDGTAGVLPRIVEETQLKCGECKLAVTGHVRPLARGSGYRTCAQCRTAVHLACDPNLADWVPFVPCADAFEVALSQAEYRCRDCLSEMVRLEKFKVTDDAPYLGNCLNKETRGLMESMARIQRRRILAKGVAPGHTALVSVQPAVDKVARKLKGPYALVVLWACLWAQFLQETNLTADLLKKLRVNRHSAGNDIIRLRSNFFAFEWHKRSKIRHSSTVQVRDELSTAEDRKADVVTPLKKMNLANRQFALLKHPDGVNMQIDVVAKLASFAASYVYFALLVVPDQVGALWQTRFGEWFFARAERVLIGPGTSAPNRDARKELLDFIGFLNLSYTKTSFTDPSLKYKYFDRAHRFALPAYNNMGAGAFMYDTAHGGTITSIDKRQPRTYVVGTTAGFDAAEFLPYVNTTVKSRAGHPTGGRMQHQHSLEERPATGVGSRGPYKKNKLTAARKPSGYVSKPKPKPVSSFKADGSLVGIKTIAGKGYFAKLAKLCTAPAQQKGGPSKWTCNLMRGWPAQCISGGVGGGGVSNQVQLETWANGGKAEDAPVFALPCSPERRVHPTVSSFSPNHGSSTNPSSTRHARIHGPLADDCRFCLFCKGFEAEGEAMASAVSAPMPIPLHMDSSGSGGDAMDKAPAVGTGITAGNHKTVATSTPSSVGGCANGSISSTNTTTPPEVNGVAPKAAMTSAALSVAASGSTAATKTAATIKDEEKGKVKDKNSTPVPPPRQGGRTRKSTVLFEVGLSTKEYSLDPRMHESLMRGSSETLDKNWVKKANYSGKGGHIFAYVEPTESVGGPTQADLGSTLPDMTKLSAVDEAVMTEFCKEVVSLKLNAMVQEVEVRREDEVWTATADRHLAERMKVLERVVQEPRKISPEEYGGILGRMLTLPPVSTTGRGLIGGFAHTNCLRFSAEVYETASGGLANWMAACLRAKQVKCFYCGKNGATVGCLRSDCKYSLHVACAAASGCQFMEARHKNDTEAVRHDVHALMACPLHVGDLIKMGGTDFAGMPTDPLRSVFANLPERNAKWGGDLAADDIAAEERVGGGGFGPSINAMLGLPTTAAPVTKTDPVRRSVELVVEQMEHFSNYSLRVGALTVLNMGHALLDSPGFHTEDIIYPHGYRAVRLFWSWKQTFKRTLYLMEVLSESDLPEKSVPPAPARSDAHELDSTELERLKPPVFRLVALDAPGEPLLARDPAHAVTVVRERLRALYAPVFAAARGAAARQEDTSFGLHAPNFFGVGLSWVRCYIERTPDAAAASSAAPPAVLYRPCYRLPSTQDVLRIEQDRHEHRARLSRPNAMGSARATGVVPMSGGGVEARAVTRILSKAAGEDDKAKNKNATEDPEDVLRTKAIIEFNKQRYTDLASAYRRNPLEKLEVRRSHIHGWGLFCAKNFQKGDMIVEYIGEKIRQAVADKREVRYEEEGVGSCYLFRLDKTDIIDATRKGGMARFMNHCCEPNAFARVIPTDDEGINKHIIIMAGRDIQEGEEVTYDYKFPLEENKLRCYCGAAKCKGYMN